MTGSGVLAARTRPGNLAANPFVRCCSAFKRCQVRGRVAIGRKVSKSPAYRVGGRSSDAAVSPVIRRTRRWSVRYDQASDSNNNPAAQLTESVNAQKANQTITFDPAGPTKPSHPPPQSAQAAVPAPTPMAVPGIDRRQFFCLG